MDVNSVYRLNWEKKPCILNGEYITEIRYKKYMEGFAEYEKYNPFDLYSSEDSKALYLDFVAVDDKSPEKVYEFIKKYGFLGINRGWEEDGITYSESGETEADIEEESIHQIVREIKIMRAIVNAWEAMYTKDINALKENALFLWETCFFWDKRDDYRKHIEETKIFFEAMGFAQMEMAAVINNRLSDTPPHIVPGCYRNETAPKFFATWRVENLLAAMYTMLYSDLTQGIMLRKCQNEKCPEYFRVIGNYENKIYCNTRCANAQAKRNERKRNAIEKARQGIKEAKQGNMEGYYKHVNNALKILKEGDFELGGIPIELLGKGDDNNGREKEKKTKKSRKR